MKNTWQSNRGLPYSVRDMKHHVWVDQLWRRLSSAAQTHGAEKWYPRMLLANGIIFKIDELQGGLPEIISEETLLSYCKMHTMKCLRHHGHWIWRRWHRWRWHNYVLITLDFSSYTKDMEYVIGPALVTFSGGGIYLSGRKHRIAEENLLAR